MVNIMRKVSLEELAGMSFDDGSKVLLESGYVQTDSAKDDDAIDCDYISDTYFKLFDDEDNEVDIKSFVQHMKKNMDEGNDDGGLDVVLSEGWEQI